jgi:hypothetical protein
MTTHIIVSLRQGNGRVHERCGGTVEPPIADQWCAEPLVKEGNMKELVLYGKRKDRTEDWHEEILLTNATPENIERVKVLAGRDGFVSFRVAEIDLSTPPDFKKAVNIVKGDL